MPSYKTSETGGKFTCSDLIVSVSLHCVNSGRDWAFVAVQRASAYPTRRAVRIDCGINPGMNALLALQVLHEARSAVAVSDLLRNPRFVLDSAEKHGVTLIFFLTFIAISYMMELFTECYGKEALPCASFSAY